MSNGIQRIPKLPDEIRDAVDKGTLAVFIGAGVSRLVDCQGWDTLAKSLVNRCHLEGIITFKESETLSQITDHKKTITICFHLFEKKSRADAFYEEMNKALNEGVDHIPNIYDDIYRLRGIFITTNADTHFDRLFNPPNILYRSSDFRANSLDSTNLYHIHGSVRDRESLIFTVPKYIQRYTQDKEFKSFLSRIFGEYTVLFLGYGLAEFEILDFIVRDTPRTPLHFMLSPFYSGEDNILDYEQSYYDDLHIKILGYEKDKNGYRQLIEVIKHWNEEITQLTTYLHSASRLIDEAVE
ncbi:MAG: SIR2 family protein [Methylococcales bacterium]|nr:SIR2 family protein [Methylococcales bacterium]